MAQLRTEEARSKGLPGSDLYEATEMIYLDESNREWIVGRLLAEAMTIFSDSIWLSKHLDIKLEGKQNKDILDAMGPVAGSQHVNCFWRMKIITQINLEYLKIFTGLEIHLKARLAYNGYVIHFIKDNGIFKHLASTQKSSPVPISDLMNVSHFMYDDIAKSNRLDGIRDKTLGMEMVLENSAYFSAAGISAPNASIFNEIRKLRNTIHLPGGSFPKTPAIDTLRVDGISMPNHVLDYVNSEIVDWANNLLLPKGRIMRPLQKL